MNGAFRRKVRDRLYIEQAGKCFYCGKECVLGNDGTQPSHKNFTLDHIVPKARGGRNSYKNFVGSCRDCNRDKAAKDFRHYLELREYSQKQLKFI